MNIEKIKFNDFVYCVSVPNKTWLMRVNNKVSWTHNCDHPDSSIISLKRDAISHRIVETWWEGKALMGKLEILTTPGYVKQGIVSNAGDQVAEYIRRGILLGISSRGIGTLKKEDGKNVVQDDFELICFDLVSSPSTPGSYLHTSRNKIDKFIESEIPKKETHNSFLTRLDNFLQ